LGRAKDIIVKPISCKDARRIICSIHYSGKVATTSRIHFGVFLDGICGGALSFGSPIDKRKMQGLVTDTGWNSFLELNRMAFADWLPRNGESRAISVCMNLIQKSYPHIEWIVSFADACQCGDGTIYRASGFVLTAIKPNRTMWRLPTGEIMADLMVRQSWDFKWAQKKFGIKAGEKWSHFSKRIGATRLPGFQLRYIYFLDPTSRERLTVPIIPFSEIEKRGAKMYKGKRPAGEKVSHPAIQSEVGGSIPTAGLDKRKQLIKF